MLANFLPKLAGNTNSGPNNSCAKYTGRIMSEQESATKIKKVFFFPSSFFLLECTLWFGPALIVFLFLLFLFFFCHWLPGLYRKRGDTVIFSYT